jgi:hypothetical protein
MAADERDGRVRGEPGHVELVFVQQPVVLLGLVVGAARRRREREALWLRVARKVKKDRWPHHHRLEHGARARGGAREQLRLDAERVAGLRVRERAQRRRGAAAAGTDWGRRESGDEERSAAGRRRAHLRAARVARGAPSGGGLRSRAPPRPRVGSARA